MYKGDELKSSRRRPHGRIVSDHHRRFFKLLQILLVSSMYYSYLKQVRQLARGSRGERERCGGINIFTLGTIATAAAVGVL